ncbi:TPA: S49 family peptidase [Vibrio parahaemolyticus]|uniref:S49 family peptidase n=1 Tax=Vibrio parahaemolyticus TaxID=670 RepID=UPI001B83DFFF|nr:S49 family peptidase [Vibrio parahaemolyticus]MCI9703466.1 S49 family peptidase [Vibrio parahaemolyticus]MDF5481604.1 S49 family peptidase [Vibrio parahaemolyticus]MDG2620752.1 S49 family peptidase [Vibrio parahaemolyticus]MDG2836454.1 S49 family peptidase [Vibrio parahaemolyticus]HBC3893854.1 S49 family peptidase [Vibrio parahaemolyticus]
MNYLSKEILSRPQLASVELFTTVSEILEDRELRKQLTSDNSGFKSTNTLINKIEALPNTKVLNVEGACTYRMNPYQMLCGGCSYQALVSQMESYAANGVKTVVMLADSGGGEAYGCFQTANTIKRIAKDNGIKLIGYCDGMAASACYALLSACESIYTHPMGNLGSIGVVVQLTDTSKALDMAGIKRIFVTAGESKISVDESGHFKEEFLQDLQLSVDELYTDFINHVVSNRPVSAKQVRDTQAKVFSASKSVDMGLADGIKTPEQFIQFLMGSEPKQHVSSHTKATAQTTQSDTPIFDAAKKANAVTKPKPMAKSEPEPELTYEQEQLQHRLKLEQAVRRAALKRKQEQGGL